MSDTVTSTPLRVVRYDDIRVLIYQDSEQQLFFSAVDIIRCTGYDETRVEEYVPEDERYIFPDLLHLDDEIFLDENGIRLLLQKFGACYDLENWVTMCRLLSKQFRFHDHTKDFHIPDDREHLESVYGSIAFEKGIFSVWINPKCIRYYDSNNILCFSDFNTVELAKIAEDIKEKFSIPLTEIKKENIIELSNVYWGSITFLTEQGFKEYFKEKIEPIYSQYKPAILMLLDHLAVKQ